MWLILLVIGFNVYRMYKKEQYKQLSESLIALIILTLIIFLGIHYGIGDGYNDYDYP